MNYISTHNSITRCTAFPLVMEVTELGDLTDGWTITFTMRKDLSSTGNPILQYTNSDILSMTVRSDKVTINLSVLDTEKIPEDCKVVFIQLNFTKLVRTVATEVYALQVLPNIIKTETPR